MSKPQIGLGISIMFVVGSFFLKFMGVIDINTHTILLAMGISTQLIIGFQK